MLIICLLLKQADDSFDVSIYAKQGSGYFSYSREVGVNQPLVEVTQYKGGKLMNPVDKCILSLMNNRWGGSFW